MLVKRKLLPTDSVFFNINPASGRPGAECNGSFRTTATPLKGSCRYKHIFNGMTNKADCVLTVVNSPPWNLFRAVLFFIINKKGSYKHEIQTSHQTKNRPEIGRIPPQSRDSPGAGNPAAFVLRRSANRRRKSTFAGNPARITGQKKPKRRKNFLRRNCCKTENRSVLPRDGQFGKSATIRKGKAPAVCRRFL